MLLMFMFKILFFSLRGELNNLVNGAQPKKEVIWKQINYVLVACPCYIINKLMQVFLQHKMCVFFFSFTKLHLFAIDLALEVCIPLGFGSKVY